jgi:putative peptidoglycan lipid II flippase
MITIPITFFTLAQGENLIRLLFQTRSFDESSVRLTFAAFIFHMPGLYFIALNRILAPAFYAQSNTKSPAIAGVISMFVNMCLAAILVGRFRGSGIAFALSFASAVNTVLLLIFLRKNKDIAIGSALGSVLLYVLKLIFISVLAAVPIYFLSPAIQEIFADRGRLISYGMPLVINGIIYAIIGVFLLAITKDKNLIDILKMVRRKSN